MGYTVPAYIGWFRRVNRLRQETGCCGSVFGIGNLREHAMLVSIIGKIVGLVIFALFFKMLFMCLRILYDNFNSGYPLRGGADDAEKRRAESWRLGWEWYNETFKIDN
jgi:hypothetical protein